MLSIALASTPTLVLAQPAPSGSEFAEAEIVALERLDVETSRDSLAYGFQSAPASTKLPVSLLETPQNIQVVPRGLLDDQGATTLDDVLKNVAGVMVGGYYENWDYYRIRGFDAAFNTYVDGLRGGNGMGEETFGLEQVEIVKGPASSLFGPGPLGGVVNLVSKRPQHERFTRLGGVLGSDDLREVTLDVNAPLAASGAVLGRLTVADRSRESHVDFADSQRLFIAPALSWQIADDTSLTILARYSDIAITHAMPLPAIGTVLPNPNGPIPHHRYVGEPGSNQGDEESVQGGYEFVHTFSDRITLRQNLRYDRYQQRWTDMLYPSHLGDDGRTLYRYPYQYWQEWHDFAVDTRVEFAIESGSYRHEIAAGVDLYRKDYSYTGQTIDFSDPAAFMPIDLYEPVYGAVPIPAHAPAFGGDEDGRLTGLYLHDHLVLPGRVTLTAGGRYDFSENIGIKAEAFTPRAGVTWEVRPQTVLYATYSESFDPQASWQLTALGQPVEPETSTNWEAGVKTAAADGRLTATAAVFELTRRNVATGDLTHPGSFIVSGEQRSRGFEFDGRFAPAAGWELLVAYAYIDAEVTADNVLPVGDRTQNVPEHAISAWTKYTFQAGPARGFGAGLGARYYTDQAGDLPNTFELPGYGLVDLALYYDRGPFSAQLNVSNALDRVYYAGAYDAMYVLPGRPRQVRLSATWSF